MRSVALTSLIALALAAGCAPKVIVVHDGDTKPTTKDGSTPVATDGPTTSNNDTDWGIKDPNDDRAYAETMAKVAGMASDSSLMSRASRRGLSVVNVSWEDPGRAEGSSIGPNISDLTLQVRRKVSRDEGNATGFDTKVMPVIRFPNFADRTGDIPADRFFVRVGNERSQSLKSVALTDVLKDLKAFAAKPDSILGSGNMIAPRDSHFLVSAQAVFLPIPKSGKAEFNPVLFNYQSAPGSPAVLAILVTRQGTSMQVIENKGEDSTAAGWGQELYFDNGGQRAAFNAERLTDVKERIEKQGGPKTEDDRTALQKGADNVFLIQIPLKHNNLGRLGGPVPSPPMMAPPAAAAGAASKPAMKKKPSPSKAAGPADDADGASSDVEQAVIGHGPNLGPFNEGHRLRFERDPKFPIRITVQFYKATSNGVASDTDLDSIAKNIGSVYEHADVVGSLVLPEGDARRPTAWQNVPHEWFPW